MEISHIFGAERQVRIVRQVLFVLTLVIAFYTFVSYANRVSDKIYSVLQSNHYCSRRLNSTHQMGCTSDLGGNFGVVWIVEDDDDLEHVLKDGVTPPYVVVLRRNYYTRKNLLAFKDNRDRVAGVVLLDSKNDDLSKRTKPFSPESRCPNQYAGLYVNDSKYDGCKANVAWQQESPVSGLLYDDIPYPIFLFRENQTVFDLEQCFKDYNLAKATPKKQDSYPLCSMQLDSFMLAASDTETCLNSHSLIDELLQANGHRCYTVDNNNIFAYFKPAIGPLHPIKEGLSRPDLVEPQSVVMLIAKLSSLSMFTELSPGADSTITSIVTLLVVAEALGKVKNDTKVVESKRNIAFALLDSEPFDYTGSSKMVYDMQNNTFPLEYLSTPENDNKTNLGLRNINLKSLDYVINLDQLANYPNTDSIHLHVDPRSSGGSGGAKLNRLADILSEVSKSEKVNFKREDESLPLPPSPAHEFIKKSNTESKENHLFGVVLSNYGSTYSNMQYYSIFDDQHNIFQTSKHKLVEHISKVASFVAKSLYKLTFNDDMTDKIVVDKDLVENLLECYLEDAKCSLFTKVLQAGQQLPRGPIQTYKDPTRKSDDMNGVITYHLLAYFTGDKMSGYNLTKCYEENHLSKIYTFHYVNGQNEPIKDSSSGICIRSQIHASTAQSPAFAVSEDGITIDSKYAAWSVSLNGIRNPARLFLKPSPVQQWCVFLLGIVVTLMSFATVYHVKYSILKSEEDNERQAGTST